MRNNENIRGLYPTGEDIFSQEIQNNFESTAILYSQESQIDRRITDEQIYKMCQQVSLEIDEYNQTHTGEMLPQNPENLLEQFQSKNSIIMAGENFDGSWQYLHHRTTYELLNSSQREALDGWNVIEFGTAITHEPYRNGHRLGQRGIVLLRDKIYDMWGENTVAIATIKQHVTGVVLSKAGARAIAWHTHPYLSFLTDSCSAFSPTFTHRACPYRRPPEESTLELLNQAINARGGAMPCTLITLDSQKAIQFEETTRRRHQELLMTTIDVGVDDRDNPEAWLSLQEFYLHLTSLGGEI